MTLSASLSNFKSFKLTTMKIVKFPLLALLFFISNLHYAQPPSSNANDVMKGLQEKAEMASNSLVKNLEFNNVGPSIMSGRVTDLAVNPDDPTEFYVGYASGGVWHTNNNGTTFSPCFTIIG